MKIDIFQRLVSLSIFNLFSLHFCSSYICGISTINLLHEQICQGDFNFEIFSCRDKTTLKIVRKDLPLTENAIFRNFASISFNHTNVFPLLELQLNVLLISFLNSTKLLTPHLIITFIIHWLNEPWTSTFPFLFSSLRKFSALPWTKIVGKTTLKNITSAKILNNSKSIIRTFDVSSL